MPRLMSFFLTTPQFKAREKTVTRRLGWAFAKVGDIVEGVEKGQGIPKGGKVKRLGMIRIVKVERQVLCRIPQWDVPAEGFPDMTAADFIAMFCEHNKCAAGTTVTRIEFEYLDPPAVSNRYEF